MSVTASLSSTTLEPAPSVDVGEVLLGPASGEGSAENQVEVQLPHSDISSVGGFSASIVGTGIGDIASFKIGLTLQPGLRVSQATFHGKLLAIEPGLNDDEFIVTRLPGPAAALDMEPSL